MIVFYSILFAVIWYGVSYALCSKIDRWDLKSPHRFKILLLLNLAAGVAAYAITRSPICLAAAVNGVSAGVQTVYFRKKAC